MATAVYPAGIVLSLDALAAVLEHSHSFSLESADTVPADGAWGVLSVRRDDMLYILDPTARRTSTRIIIDDRGQKYFGGLRGDGRLVALRRMHRLAVQASKRPLYLPPQWSQYSSGDLITGFAYPHTYGAERFVAKITAESGYTDVYFCAITNADNPIDLDDYLVDDTVLTRARQRYDIAVTDAEAIFARLGRPPSNTLFDFDAVGARAITGGRTYTVWLNSLSDSQTRFVLQAPDHSVKLRGPAGSGKTIALELKALRACYEAMDGAEDLRILFATHSWGVAEQVQASLEQLDERDALSHIDVFPLLTLAQLALEERGRLNVLGDDSYTGKVAQLEELATLLDATVTRDWVAYRASASDEFAERVTASRGTPAYNRFLWDLMLEFSGVIGANGILPGINAERRYLQLERRAWMMPLDTDAEKQFVFLLYTRFVKQLRARQQMSSDQVIADYLNYLTTFRWYSERPSRGYDLIFVDEYHLFNEQERLVFHSLTRDPDKYPVVFMALDPRQSPTEAYAAFAAEGTAPQDSGAAEAALGSTTSVELDQVYRYTPEILEFLKLIDRFYPTLDLGADWGFNLTHANSTRTSGEVPKLTVHATESAERRAALAEAADVSRRGLRVAVLALDMDSFREIQDDVESLDLKTHIIESREDVDKLHYTRQGIILSQPQYVAGLQFDAVVITGIAASQHQYAPNQSYSLRRFLSDVYLGASRARDILRLHAHQDGGDLPQVLQIAIRDNIVVRENEAFTTSH